MKLFLVLVSTFAIAKADSIGQGGYSGGGGGSFNFGSKGYLTGGNNIAGAFGNSAAGGYSAPGFGAAPAGPSDAASQGPQVYKYVSVHSAPEDPEDQATKTVRVPGGSNKHVNIIFVKAPSNGADQKTEIVLPEQDEHKNLVYVLVQKTDVAANLNIRKPQPTKPSKPEVYFIRYKNNGAQQGQAGGEAPQGAGPIGGGEFGPSAGAPSPAYGAPSPAYGAP